MCLYARMYAINNDFPRNTRSTVWTRGNIGMCIFIWEPYSRYPPHRQVWWFIPTGLLVARGGPTAVAPSTPASPGHGGRQAGALHIDRLVAEPNIDPFTLLFCGIE